MPGARLILSNRNQRLADAFVDEVAQQRAGGLDGLFAPVHLVVPARPVEDFLKQALAVKLGVAANIRNHFLTGFLAEVATTSFPDARVVDRRTLQGWLLALLGDDKLLAEPAMAQARAYLHAAGDAAAAIDRRRLQLSARLSHLFDDRLLDAEPPRDLPPWQARLWNAMFGPTGLARDRGLGPPWLILPELFRAGDAAALQVPSPVHVYGLPPWSRLFELALPTLARRADVLIYALGPGPELAAPSPAPGASQPGPARKQLGLFDRIATATTGPAMDWGRPARLWPARLARAFPTLTRDERFEPRADPSRSLLAAVQTDLAGDSAGDKAATAADDSVVVLACPSLRREVEAIAGEIWRALDAFGAAGTVGGATRLRFDDIAVLVPAADAESYFTHVAAVFKEAGDIPHQLLGAHLGRTSPVFEAVDQLLTLPTSAFTRAEVLRLCCHPLVIARFPDATPDDWRRFCDELGIIRGADNEDHQGTYVDQDLWSWLQGLRRLALGAFLPGPAEGDGRPFVLPDGALCLPADVPAGDLPRWLGFARFLRSLIADTRFAHTARLTLPEWVSFLRALIKCVVVPGSPADERALAACLAEIAALAEMPVPGPVGYTLVAELVRHAQDTLTANRASHPTVGVTVAAFLPVRAVPFRVVFAAGLGAGCFPGPDSRDELDPRPAGPPDAPTPSEQDRAVLQEALLGASDRIVLSWVARDLQTGDHLEASSVIREIIEQLGARLPAPGAAAGLVRRPPLHRHDDPAARSVFPATAGEVQARALGLHLRAGLPDARAPLDLPWLRAHLSADTLTAVSGALGLTALPSAAAKPGIAARPGPRRVRLAHLRRFLECPLQGSAMALLGLRDSDDDEDLLTEDEPFTIGPLTRAIVLRDTFLTALRAARSRAQALTPPSLEAAYDETITPWRLGGRLPIGVFGDTHRAGHLAVLVAWAADLMAVAGDAQVAWELVHFGGADRRDAPGSIRAALSIAATTTHPLGGHPLVALSGPTSPIVTLPGGTRASLVLVASEARDGVTVANRKDSLKGYLDHLALAAAGGDGPHRVYIFRPGQGATTGSPPMFVDFPALTPTAARAELGALLSDMLAGVHEYLLPCEAVFRAHESPGKSLPDLVAELRDMPFRSFSSRLGPVPFPERYPVPSDAEGRALIARRFAGYFRGVLSPAKGN